MTPTRRRGTSDDRGSVLPLVIAAVVIVLLLVGAVTDASVLWLRRRAVQAEVDGAALAGAQAVDLGAVYAGGATGDLRLDAPRVRSAVRAWVRAAPDPVGLRVTSITVRATEVTVRGTSSVALPFTTLLTGSRVTVVAEASAVLRVP